MRSPTTLFRVFLPLILLAVSCSAATSQAGDSQEVGDEQATLAQEPIAADELIDVASKSGQTATTTSPTPSEKSSKRE